MVVIEDYKRFQDVPADITSNDVAAAVERCAQAEPGARMALTVMVEGGRTVRVASIASVFTPEETVGRQVQLPAVVREAVFNMGVTLLESVKADVAEIEWPVGDFEAITVRVTSGDAARSFMRMFFCEAEQRERLMH